MVLPLVSTQYPGVSVILVLSKEGGGGGGGHSLLNCLLEFVYHIHFKMESLNDFNATWSMDGVCWFERFVL